MSTDRSRTPLPELAGAIVIGAALVVLTLAVLVAMHVLTGRLLTDGDAQRQEVGATAGLRVPSHETAGVLVLGVAAAPGTMGA
ncbi:hypothetical protein M3148_14380 [Georgenia satyanarayanai]|uniref:hypothetical protein n=1 Tax=Georgenia satyanarayanai TaxID=860221 RepID=UPI00204196F3|nr:hypothetical protein [Georgenia satyanarayanai]MCM3662168.1 hypothetical protein [Georgenia satyanarayanai]